MSYTRTVSEFSSVRKIKYGENNSANQKEKLNDLNSRPYGSPLTCEEAMSPHQAYFSKDSNGNEVYVVEFNIGRFKFDELTIRTEGLYSTIILLFVYQKNKFYLLFLFIRLDFFFEGKKLYVQGKSKVAEGSTEELSREFKREFKLPDDCNADSVKAELDEKTRLLKLVGQVIIK
jgi:hypothetical protein